MPYKPRSTRDITLTQAIFYAEWPMAAERDFDPQQIPALYRRMDRLFKKAEADDSLAWQAYKARLARKPRVNVVEDARSVATQLRLGALAMPDVPAAPTPPDPAERGSRAALYQLR